MTTLLNLDSLRRPVGRGYECIKGNYLLYFYAKQRILQVCNLQGQAKTPDLYFDWMIGVVLAGSER